MPDAAPSPDQSLHLPSLVIKNFRGINELTIPRLGRVTLLAGKNGVGKTTVLDAVRVWADRSLTTVFDAVLRERGDAFSEVDGDRQKVFTDRLALFADRTNPTGSTISIGPIDDPNFTIQIKQIPRRLPDPYAPNPPPMPHSHFIELERRFGQYDPKPPAISDLLRTGSEPDALNCNILGPDGPDDEMIERLWNKVALRTHEDRAVEALNLATADEVERTAMIGPSSGDEEPYRRRMMVKVSGAEDPRPLRALGEGAMRCFATALALAASTDGFLLIDEAENGIHHSVQAKFWKMILQTAHRNNVQVLATTHSSDCAYRFGQVASELEDIEGILYRIQRNGERLRAVPYPEDQLVIAAEHGIEVR